MSVPISMLQQQATTLYQSGRLDEALAICRQIIAAQPNRTEVLAFAGIIALDLGRPAEAAELFGAVVVHKPDFAEAHFNLGNALKQLGRLDEAASAYQRVIELRAEIVPAHVNLANTLLALDRLEEAEANYVHAIELAPEVAEIHRGLGIVLRKRGKIEAAAEAFRKTLAIDPEHTAARSGLAMALMEGGDPRGAVEACDEWLKRVPGEIEALSIKSHALNEFADPETVRFFFDFDRLVRTVDIDAPSGYENLAAFNAALAEHASTHPTLHLPPEDDPTYHHPALHITNELLEEPKGPMADLEQVILGNMEDYRRTVPADPPHPFLESWPNRWRLTSWAVVLKGEGNLMPHIHLEGHLGGVYYPELPDLIGDAEGGHAGWFEVGRAPPELHCKAESEVRLLQPREGRMLLFPSYFYHRTLPFQSDQRRISIAFDMVPEG